MPSARGTFAALLATAAATLCLAATAQAKVGDVYLVDTGGPGLAENADLFVFPAGGGEAKLTRADLGIETFSVALHPGGNLFVADDRNGDGAIRRVNRFSGVVTPFLGPPDFGRGRDVAVGPDGFLYVLDFLPGSLQRVNPRTGAHTPVIEDIVQPPFVSLRHMVVDRNGTIYLTDAIADAVFRIDSRTGATTTLYSGPEIAGARGIALSPDQTLVYVTATGTDQVVRIRTSDGTVVRETPGFSDPTGIALLPTGQFLVANEGDANVVKVGVGGSPIATFSADPDLTEPQKLVVEPSPCAGRLPTIVGSTRRDVLRGSRFADVISGLGGADRILGLGGNDLICGGKGNDFIAGGKGRDRLLGGRGRDRLRGGPGRDRLLGGPGRDRLLGGPGRDRLRGGPGRDRQRQ